MKYKGKRIHNCELAPKYPQLLLVDQERCPYCGELMTGLVGFDQVIIALKEGYRARRSGWNGKGMWIALSLGSKNLSADKFWNPHNREFALDNGGVADVLPCITMKTADNKILMGWLASQTDMLAEDWEIF